MRVPLKTAVASWASLLNIIIIIIIIIENKQSSSPSPIYVFNIYSERKHWKSSILWGDTLQPLINSLMQ